MKKMLDGLGADAEWRVRQGCVWRTEGQFEIDCVPVDITTATITAIITSGPTSQVPLKTFTVTIIDAVNGIFAIEIAEGNADLAVGSYWWAIEWDIGYGAEPLVSGPFIVQPWVFP